MLTECIPDVFGFAPVEGRKVMAAFDGGKMTSDAGAMLLGATNRDDQFGRAVCRLFRGSPGDRTDRA